VPARGEGGLAFVEKACEGLEDVWNAGCDVEGDGDVVGGGAGGQADGIVVFGVPERILMLCWRSSLSLRRAVVNAPGNLLVGRGRSDTRTTKQPLRSPVVSAQVPTVKRAASARSSKQEHSHEPTIPSS
jgi:hypothetical protein